MKSYIFLYPNMILSKQDIKGHVIIIDLILEFLEQSTKSLCKLWKERLVPGLLFNQICSTKLLVESTKGHILRHSEMWRIDYL